MIEICVYQQESPLSIAPFDSMNKIEHEANANTKDACWKKNLVRQPELNIPQPNYLSISHGMILVNRPSLKSTNTTQTQHPPQHHKYYFWPSKTFSPSNLISNLLDIIDGIDIHNGHSGLIPRHFNFPKSRSQGYQLPRNAWQTQRRGTAHDKVPYLDLLHLLTNGTLVPPSLQRVSYLW